MQAHHGEYPYETKGIIVQVAESISAARLWRSQRFCRNLS